MENKNLLTDDDLADLFSEFESEENKIDSVDDEEMEASNRRYEEIIKKHAEE